LDCDGGGDGGGGGDGTIGGFGGEFGGDVSGGSGTGGSGGNVGGAGSAGPSGEAGQLSSNPADMGQHNAAPAPAPSSGGSPDSSVAAAVANYGQQSITPTTTEGFFSSLVSHFTNEPINMAKSMMNFMSPIPMAFSLAEVTSQTLDAMVGFLGGQPDATAAGAGAGSQGGPVGPEQVKQALVNMGYQYNPSTGSYINPSPVVQAQNTLTAFNQASIDSALQRIRDVDTDIEYNKTLADLSGIQMDATEKALLDSQKQIAIDRALNTIEDTFSQEGESMVAQQIQNLGANALGGTIGQGFVKRWQEREAAAKTGALQDIESTYLAAERQAIDQQKQRQIDMWDKDYDAEVKTAELSLDKAKAESLLQYQWDQSYLQDATTRRGQDITSEQANLDRLLNERMGNVSIGAYEDANKWSTVAGVGGAIAGGIARSDWFGDIATSWF
jgi:hypothetical protein